MIKEPTMPHPHALSDDRFLADFLACRLPAAGFDHWSHLRAAWLLLQRHPLEEAVERCCDGIARLATHLGVPGKYHRTLSEALVRLIAVAGAVDQPWPDFLAANPNLVNDARGLLSRYYSPERLADPLASSTFLSPDLAPLPPCPPLPSPPAP